MMLPCTHRIGGNRKRFTIDEGGSKIARNSAIGNLTIFGLRSSIILMFSIVTNGNRKLCFE